ncbi:MAG: hypothetical protein RDU20_22665 [Desulfomonilaceae bacterium]|nr:hypothetical protein [Desulfomonilaceae bacterium]
MKTLRIRIPDHAKKSDRYVKCGSQVEHGEIPLPPLAPDHRRSDASVNKGNLRVSDKIPGNCAGKAFAFVGIAALAFALSLSVLIAPSEAEPLDHYVFATVGYQGFFSRIDGRMGFARNINPLVSGTLNDFRKDLGLPADQESHRILLSLRPLEHHALRLYGSIPEVYNGETTLQREIRTRNFIFPAGTFVTSKLHTGMFGFGYDLDFLVGPRWVCGLNGDLRYLDLKVQFGTPESGDDDTIQFDELVPCLGAHFETKYGLGGNGPLGGLSIGGLARMTYGITPNFVNYVDINVGLLLGFAPMGGRAVVEAKVGYEHESFFNQLENITGSTLEMKRDGIFCSLEGAF